MLARKKKRISILYQETYPLNDYLYFRDSLMAFAVFFQQRLLKRANILHLKTAIAFHHQPYRFGLLVLAGKVYL